MYHILTLVSFSSNQIGYLMHKMVTMETNGDLMVKMLNSVGYTPDKYLLGLKYVKSSVYYILLKNALTSHFSLFWDPTTATPPYPIFSPPLVSDKLVLRMLDPSKWPPLGYNLCQKLPTFCVWRRCACLYPF